VTEAERRKLLELLKSHAKRKELKEDLKFRKLDRNRGAQAQWHAWAQF
jgi:hypothetical protein